MDDGDDHEYAAEEEAVVEDDDDSSDDGDGAEAVPGEGEGEDDAVFDADADPGDGGLARRGADTRALIIREPRVLSDVLTLYEFSRAVGVRAEQIAKTGVSLVEHTLTSAIAIALKEIRDGRCPLKIRKIAGRRSDGTRIVEIWPINEMVLPVDAKIDPASWGI